MSVKDITPGIVKLAKHLDRVEDELKPLIGNLSTLASQLPLLDKAKLFALTAYSINALLHSAVRIEGISAQSHPITTELKRVQQYFAKIQTAETKPTDLRENPNPSVNTEAVARVLKHDLGANDPELKQRLAEHSIKERANALLNSLGSRPKKRAAEQPAAEHEAGQNKKAAATNNRRSRSKKQKTKRL